MIEPVASAQPVSAAPVARNGEAGPAAPPPALNADTRLALVREPETRVAEPFKFAQRGNWFQRAKAGFFLAVEAVKTWLAPGQWVGRNSEGGKKGIRRLREAGDAAELAIPFKGVARGADGGWTAPAIANPWSPDGKFDPFAYMPRLAFHPKEDSFPVLPDRDGSGDASNDVERYRHGVIGGAQPLQGAVTVARKGEYVVMTYSMFYVDNKAGSYHREDSSTVSVYLKPGQDGQLRPAYLYSSWHYGASMARWEDVKQDADGRPVIRVERGSHALRPLAPWEGMPKGGVVVDGQGGVAIDGKPSAHHMTWVTPQGTFRNAEAFDAGDPRRRTLMDQYYRIYQERRNPVHPTFFGFDI